MEYKDGENAEKEVKLPRGKKVTKKCGRILSNTDLTTRVDILFSKLNEIFENKDDINNDLMTFLNKFCAEFQQGSIPYAVSFESFEIAEKIISFMNPANPLTLNISAFISILTRSSNKYAEAFFEANIIDKIFEFLFKTKMTRELTRDLLIILYDLTNIAEGYRNIIFDRMNYAKLIDFCIKKPDNMKLINFLLEYTIILFKYDPEVEEGTEDDKREEAIYGKARNVIDILYEENKFNPKYQPLLVRLIKYMSFYQPIVELIQESSIGHDLFEMLSQGNVKIISDVAIIYANAMKNGVEMSSELLDSLDVFFSYQSVSDIVVPACDLLRSLIMKDLIPEEKINIEFLISLVSQEDMKIKKYALRALNEAVLKSNNNTFNVISFNGIDALINALESDDRDMIRTALSIIRRCVDLSYEYNSSSKLFDEFDEKGGVDILTDVFDNIEDPEIEKSIDEFLSKYITSDSDDGD